MDLTKCTKEIVKVGKNNVEVRYSLFTADGTPEIVHVESFGEARITKDLTSANQEKVRLSEYSTSEEIAVQDSVINELLEITAAIEG